MPWSITRPQCWRCPDFDKSGPILQFMSCWHSSTQDAEELLNHGCCGVGVVQDRCRRDGQDRESRNACVTDINLNILATTSPPLWEEKAECWWLSDGWLIQEPSDPMMDHSQTEQVVGHTKTVSSGVWGKRRHAEGKHADAVCAY